MILDEDGRPLVPVHTCYNDAEAALVISFLEAYGVAAQANSEVPHSVLPLTVGHLGKVRVLVNEDDAEEACGLLAEAQAGRLPLEHGEATPM
ncbi:MAG: DUF2007 domain-containing protein [FCB group bacterium]|jgi:hypothetical protein|nr:DUF2007 domain-containing protein [FCB group bacterium]